MDKKEILARSRNQKSDEGMDRAENQGRKLGVSAFCCIFILIILVNLFNGQESYAEFAMFWAFVAAEAFPKYRFTHNKAFLVSTVAGTIASLMSFLSFIMATVR